MKNYIQPGDYVEIVASAAISSGDMVVIGELHGVAAKDAAIGEKVNLHTVGVYSLPKKTGSGKALDLGDHVHFDSSEQKCDVSGGAIIGVCVEAAADGASSVKVKLT